MYIVSLANYGVSSNVLGWHGLLDTLGVSFIYDETIMDLNQSGSLCDLQQQKVQAADMQ